MCGNTHQDAQQIHAGVLQQLLVLQMIILVADVQIHVDEFIHFIKEEWSVPLIQ